MQRHRNRHGIRSSKRPRMNCDPGSATVRHHGSYGQTTVTTNSSLDFSGGVVLYATKLSGSLLGVPITLTPGNVVTALLKLLNSLTPLVQGTMTNVTTDDFLVASDSLQANDLNITSG